MPNTPAPVSTRAQLHPWIQPGGPSPLNPVLYTGTQTGYCEITGTTNPVLGGVEPINVFDPLRAGRYAQVGNLISDPKLPEMTLNWYEQTGAGIPLPEQIRECPFNVYESKGQCTDISDLNSGWANGNMTIYSYGRVTDFNPGDRSAFKTDAELKYEQKVVLQSRYMVSGINLSEISGLTTPLEFTDVVYGKQSVCGNCSDPNDGSRFIYACTKGAVAAKPQVVYSLDGGKTWTQQDITPSVVAENAVAIEVAGNKLIVLSKTAGGGSIGGYYYATLGTSGAPGAFTKVSTGFVSTFAPNDIAVLASNEIFFVGDGGYIYFSSDLSAGVSTQAIVGSANLLRVRGIGQTLVAVGATSTIIASSNRGKNWAAVAAIPASATFQAVEIIDDNKFWVGTNGGQVFFTNNGGNSWTEKKFSGSGAGNVYDIVAATFEVVYFSYASATPTASIFATFTGGAGDLTSTTPRFVGTVTLNVANRIAVPTVAQQTIAANTITFVGLKTGTTGTIFTGSAAVR